MRYLSVCSGIEAVSVAWQPLGWRPAMFAEIEPFCAWLLHERHGATRPVFMPSPHDAPDRKEAKHRAAAIRNIVALPAEGAVINAGDFMHIGVEDVGAIDLLAGGTPCQAFSVAGKRAGLDDPRGNLTIEFARLADRVRPLWVVWENVPGVLSIDGGRTFGAFLAMLVECGYGVAYRVLDARHFGVPQRRRRVFVVGHLGDWRRAAAVLLERSSLSGYPPPRREARKDTTRIAGAGARTDRSLHVRSSSGDTAHCLNAGGMGRQDFETETLITDSLYIDDFDSIEDGTERGAPLAPIAICTAHTKSNGRRFSADLAYALVRGSNQAVAFNLRGRQGGADSCDIAPTLRSLGHDAVAISADRRGEIRESPVYGSLTAARSATQFNGVMQEMAVRRLTPRECERLQGFPDDYTLIPYRGKLAADGPRYKALGNSMAVSVMRWIGERIAAVHAIPEDLESHAR